MGTFLHSAHPTCCTHLQASSSSDPTPVQAPTTKAGGKPECESSFSTFKFLLLAILAISGGIGAYHLLETFKETTLAWVGAGSEDDDQVVMVLHTCILQGVALLCLFIFYGWNSAREKAQAKANIKATSETKEVAKEDIPDAAAKVRDSRNESQRFNTSDSPSQTVEL